LVNSEVRAGATFHPVKGTAHFVGHNRRACGHAIDYSHSHKFGHQRCNTFVQVRTAPRDDHDLLTTLLGRDDALDSRFEASAGGFRQLRFQSREQCLLVQNNAAHCGSM